MKNFLKDISYPRGKVKKVITMTKFLLIFLIITLNAEASLYSQDSQVTLKCKNSTYDKVFIEIEKQTNYLFVYNIDDTNMLGKLNLNFSNTKLKEVLDYCFANTNLSYKLLDNHIIVNKKVESLVQQKTVVKGKVVDENGNPMPGVTIIVEGTSMGTATNIDGLFEIDLPIKNGKLVVSFVGYKKKVVEFKEGQELTIKMEISSSSLDEVTVQAYGTTTRRKMTGSISTVKGKELETVANSSVASLLQGKVAGMDVSNLSGAPGGGGSQVTIRGFNSLNIEGARQFSNPLWVVDGIPINSGVSEATGTSMLADINPDMIESIEVLKDASAAAMYGSRAANGVIIITTKQGKKNQKAKLTVNLSHTYSVLPKLPTVTIGKAERDYRLKALYNFKTAYYDKDLSEYRYATSIYDSYLRRGISGGEYNYFYKPDLIDMPFFTSERGLMLQDSLNPYYNNSTNFLPKYYSEGKVSKANIQCQGGTQNAVYSLGAGYFSEDGILTGTGYDRFSLVSNTKIDLSEKLNVGSNINLTISKRDRSAGSKGSGGSAVESIPGRPLTMSSLYPGKGLLWDKLMEQQIGIDEKNKNVRIIADFSLEYKINKDLSFMDHVANDLLFARRNTFNPSTNSRYGWSKSTGINENKSLFLNESILKYQKQINDHNIKAIAVFAYQKEVNELYTGSGENSPSDDIYYVPNEFPNYEILGRSVKTFKYYSSNRLEKTLLSYLTRFEYDYKSKYLFSASIRADGSSVFGKNNKWGYFPSVSGGWVFSEESFMNWADFVDFAKIRASWGRSGKQFEQAYLALGLLQAGESLRGLPTIHPVWKNGMYNPNLSWEETDQLDIGFDLDFMNYKLNVTFDYYLRNTRDLLFPLLISGANTYYAYGERWTNAAEISNAGFELSLKYNVINSQDIFWKVNLNLAKNWNRFNGSYTSKDLKYYDQQAREYTDYVIGRKLNGIYGFKTAGFYSSDEEVPVIYTSGGQSGPLNANFFSYENFMSEGHYKKGDYRILDINGDNAINLNDKVYLGSALPNISGGLASEFRWKNFQCNMLFSFQIGRDIVNLLKHQSIHTDGANSLVKPLFTDLNKADFWEKPGDKAYYQQMTLDTYGNGMQVLDKHIENVSWVKLKTLSLRYNFTEDIIKKIGVSGLSTFISCENLFCIDNYSGMDPESVDIRTGLDYGTNYQLARKITLGLNINF